MMKTIAKKYRIIGLLGTGGMSEVYLAQNLKTGMKVAVKILDHKLSKDESYIERFKREVEISKTLSHPNIVRIISHGIDKGRYYIVYEYIEGQTLDRHIRSKKLSIKEIEDITLQILNGLSYARSKNIIHRDIKPSNIMVSKNGKVKILDFGIARATTKSTITKTGMFMGSPHYTSPEQIDGKKIDHRTDIYSLGIVLYEMVEGKVPFQADTPLGFVRAHLDKSVPKIKRDIPDYLEETIYKCLAKDPSDRFSSAEEISNAFKLKSYADKTIIKSIKPEKPREVKKPLSTGKILLITFGSLAILAIIIVSIILGVYYGSGEQIVDEVALETAGEEVADIPSDFKPVNIIEIRFSPPRVSTNGFTKIDLFFDEYVSDIETIWSCESGKFTGQDNSAATWQAPSTGGYYFISVTSKLYNSSDSSSIRIQVMEEEKDSEVNINKDVNPENATDYTNMDSEYNFVIKVSNLLDEYNLAFNHMSTYHKEGWIFNDPNEIALEETFLVKLIELSNKLKGFSYPSSYTSHRNNLINISDELNNYENAVIKCMKNNDYNGCVNNFDLFWVTVDKLFNYYNSLSDEYNAKY